MQPVAFAPLSAAVIAAMEGAGVPVGDGEVPAGAGWQGTPGQSNYVGYILFQDLSGGRWVGMAHDRFADPRTLHQGQVVGATAAQVRKTADAARVSLAAMRNGVVAGQKVDSILFDFTAENLLRDDDVQPSVFYCPLRVRLQWTPA